MYSITFFFNVEVRNNQQQSSRRVILTKRVISTELGRVAVKQVYTQYRGELVYHTLLKV